MLPSNDHVDEILKGLTEQNFISIFFITLDLLSPEKFLEIVKHDRNFMEEALKKLLKDNEYKKNFLIEILMTIKKYRALRLLNSCRHMKKFHCELNKFWKFLYEICEEMVDDDFKYLRTLFSSELPEDTCPEILLVKAYQQKIFTENNLTNLSKAFKYHKPHISKRLDDYDGSDDFYHVSQPTQLSPCGLAVIVNHVEFKSNDPVFRSRKDSLLDVEALEKLWIMFGFKVDIHYDLSDVEVIKLFEALAKEDLSSYDVFVTCYLSHGSQGVVYGSNCKPISISKLEDIMANHCITLVNKPKLFFIQACQGGKFQQGILNESVSLKPAKNLENISNTRTGYCSNVAPLYCDVLTVVSTIPGYLSFGPFNENTWFINALVTNMEKYGHECPVQEVMTKVVKQVTKQKGQYKGVTLKQTPIIYSTMVNKLLLKRCM